MKTGRLGQFFEPRNESGQREILPEWLFLEIMNECQRKANDTIGGLPEYSLKFSSDLIGVFSVLLRRAGVARNISCNHALFPDIREL
jgi:hypothetical protein